MDSMAVTPRRFDRLASRGDAGNVPGIVIAWELAMTRHPFEDDEPATSGRTPMALGGFPVKTGVSGQP
jgi:hypothetical protein